MSSASTGQSRPKDTSNENKESKSSTKVMLIRRGRGQSWEEYKNTCIDIFRKAGMIKDE